jgi:hypothetical protein
MRPRTLWMRSFQRFLKRLKCDVPRNLQPNLFFRGALEGNQEKTSIAGVSAVNIQREHLSS